MVIAVETAQCVADWACEANKYSSVCVEKGLVEEADFFCDKTFSLPVLLSLEELKSHCNCIDTDFSSFVDVEFEEDDVIRNLFYEISDVSVGNQHQTTLLRCQQLIDKIINCGKLADETIIIISHSSILERIVDILEENLSPELKISGELGYACWSEFRSLDETNPLPGSWKSVTGLWHTSDDVVLPEKSYKETSSRISSRIYTFDDYDSKIEDRNPSLLPPISKLYTRKYAAIAQLKLPSTPAEVLQDKIELKFYNACKDGIEHLVRILYRTYPLININKYQPILAAIKNRHEKILDFLLSLPEIKVQIFEKFTENSLLFVALTSFYLFEDQIRVVTKLLNAGADIDIGGKGGGNSPLATTMDPRIARFLIERNADVNLIDNETGWSLLMKQVDAYTTWPLAMFEEKSIVELILESDRCTTVNYIGRHCYTALLIAVEKGFDDIVSLLLKHGANPNPVTPSGSCLLEIASESIAMKLIEAIEMSSCVSHGIAIPLGKAATVETDNENELSKRITELGEFPNEVKDIQESEVDGKRGDDVIDNENIYTNDSWLVVNEDIDLPMSCEILPLPSPTIVAPTSTFPRCT
jgi:ankyrin repeat protein